MCEPARDISRSDYESSLTINAPVEQVYSFVSDIKNMPKYMPTTKCAEKAGEERVRVQGKGEGFTYDTEGYLKRNENEDCLEWGSDEDSYRGWMKVEKFDDNASKVTIHLKFKGHEYDSIPCEHVTQGLHAGLESIKNELEGTGGKVKPPIEL